MDKPRIATVAELQNEGVLLVEDGNHGEYRPLSHEFGDTGTPFIRPDDLKDGRVDFVGCDRINEEALCRIRKGKGRAGDIVFTHRATVGRIARVGPDAPDFVANPGVTVWRAREPDVLDPAYLYFYMQTAQFMNQVWAEAGNTDTFPYVSLTQQRGLKVSIPSIDDQRAIGMVLGALDDKIELNRRMNATLEAMARALFQSWFVDFDPVRVKLAGGMPAGLDEDAAALFSAGFQVAPAGRVPQGWRTGRIKDCCSGIQNGGTPRRDQQHYWDGGDIPWLTSGEVRQPVIISTEGFITEEGLSESSAKWVPALSTVVALYGATAGQVSLTSAPLTTNQAVCSLIPKDGFAFFNYFAMREATNRLASRAVGSAQQNISKGIVEETEVVLPPPPIVGQFGHTVRPILERWISNLHQSRTLADLRDTLLPKLLSGELRVH